MNLLENTNISKLKSYLEESDGYSIYDAEYFIDEIGLPADFVNNLIVAYEPGLRIDKTSQEHIKGKEPISITGVSSHALLFKLANILQVEHEGEATKGRGNQAMVISQAILQYLETV